MNAADFSEAGIAQQPLIDEAQWARLINELGLDMLREFAGEFVQETLESWIDIEHDPLAVPDAQLKSLAHRSAGAAGTIAFKRLRTCFLCLEQEADPERKAVFFYHMKATLTLTREWLAQQ